MKSLNEIVYCDLSRKLENYFSIGDVVECISDYQTFVCKDSACKHFLKAGEQYLVRNLFDKTVDLTDENGNVFTCFHMKFKKVEK